MNTRSLLPTAIVVVVLALGVAVYFAVTTLSQTTSTSSEVVPGSGSGGGGGGAPPQGGTGRILSYTLKNGSLGYCTDDSQCNKGSACKNGACTISQCTQCVPYATTESGNGDCLDYWDETANEQLLLDKTGSTFAAPINSHQCENLHPHFELETPAGACSVSYTNRCQQQAA